LKLKIESFKKDTIYYKYLAIVRGFEGTLGAGGGAVTAATDAAGWEGAGAGGVALGMTVIVCDWVPVEVDMGSVWCWVMVLSLLVLVELGILTDTWKA
jgi:hypothetical protein